MLWLHAKTLVVLNKHKESLFLRAANTKVFIILGVCLKQPSTKQAIKTFTEHCACLSNSFAEKPQKLRKAETQNPHILLTFLYQTNCVYVKENTPALVYFR
jgi:hypothetical protein